MNIYQNIFTHWDAYTRAAPLQPRGIMVHSTGGAGDHNSFIPGWDVPNLGKSVHGFLDDTGFYQVLPWTYKAGHCGGDGNNYLIGFEICEPRGTVYNNSFSKIIEYNPDPEYFPKVWAMAVELCAGLCQQFGFTAQDIICHSEGHQLGIASNHGDVMHWWPLENKTMNDFRNAVNEKMGNPVTLKPITTTGSIEPEKTIADMKEEYGSGSSAGNVVMLVTMGAVLLALVVGVFFMFKEG